MLPWLWASERASSAWDCSSDPSVTYQRQPVGMWWHLLQLALASLSIPASPQGYDFYGRGCHCLREDWNHLWLVERLSPHSLKEVGEITQIYSMNPQCQGGKEMLRAGYVKHTNDLFNQASALCDISWREGWQHHSLRSRRLDWTK